MPPSSNNNRSQSIDRLIYVETLSEASHPATLVSFAESSTAIGRPIEDRKNSIHVDCRIGTTGSGGFEQWS